MSPVELAPLFDIVMFPFMPALQDPAPVETKGTIHVKMFVKIYVKIYVKIHVEVRVKIHARSGTCRDQGYDVC